MCIGPTLRLALFLLVCHHCVAVWKSNYSSLDTIGWNDIKTWQVWWRQACQPTTDARWSTSTPGRNSRMPRRPCTQTLLTRSVRILMCVFILWSLFARLVTSWNGSQLKGNSCSKLLTTPQCVLDQYTLHSIHQYFLLFQCIKFKTFSSIFLNRFEALNLSLIQKMQNRRQEHPKSVEEQHTSPTETIAKSSTPVASVQTAPIASGVAKKKKPKKKK